MHVSRAELSSLLILGVFRVVVIVLQKYSASIPEHFGVPEIEEHTWNPAIHGIHKQFFWTNAPVDDILATKFRKVSNILMPN